MRAILTLILLAVLGIYPAAAQMDVDEGKCAFRAELFKPQNGILLYERGRTIPGGRTPGAPLYNPDNPHRFKLQLRNPSGGVLADEWYIRIESTDCGPNGLTYTVTQKDVTDQDTMNFMTPVFCGGKDVNLTVSEPDDDGATGPDIRLNTYQLDTSPRQLGIIDKNSEAGPNWCQVSEYQAMTNESGATAAKTYSPAPDRFAPTVDSVVYIGFADRNEINQNYEGLSGCTGFFVADNLIMTNRHCVCPAVTDREPAKPVMLDTHCPPGNNPLFTGAELYADPKTDRADRESAYEWRVWSRQSVTSRMQAPTWQSATPVLLGQYPDDDTERRVLDYALLRIKSDAVPSAQRPEPLKLAMAPDYSRNAPLAIPQYPGNYPFVINYDSNCKVFSGESSPPGKWSFVTHGCDTAQGSSGSPVLQRDLAAVIGVHRCCWGKNDNRIVKMAEEGQGIPVSDLEISDFYSLPNGRANNFVPIAAIINDVKSQDVCLYNEIARDQGWPEEGENADTCTN